MEPVGMPEQAASRLTSAAAAMSLNIYFFLAMAARDAAARNWTENAVPALATRGCPVRFVGQNAAFHRVVFC
jgi:hypothetical protein